MDDPAGSELRPPGRSCLSDEELLAVRAMTPGQMRADIAAHLASCERCQRLALFGAARGAASPAREAPSLGKAFVRIAIVLVAMAMVLASIAILLGS